MMGAHHAGTGAAAWVAVTATSPVLHKLEVLGQPFALHLIPSFSVMPMDPAAVAIGGLVAAGAALLPDADHHNATIAYSIPGVGKAVTAAVGKAAGGHRHGTHSGLSAIVVFLLAYILTTIPGIVSSTPLSPYVIISGVVAAAMLCFALKVLKVVRSWGMAWLVGLASSAAITFLLPEQWSWLPWAIAIGWVTHMAGDFLTVGGLPLTWPKNFKPPQWVQNTPVLKRIWMKNGYWSLPILGLTGSARESMLAVPLTLYGLWGIGASAFLLLPFI
ncbi:metal-dependent hydrolase [Microbacterium sp. 77mftsu3.1]|uniref:metal-dependent hydrolase n=1 Tax=Microbacterium sp. 77mftsu3.1 TaxID=1761802 RepID=UPI000381E26C|nr:metal-dependent hydrolase [Microbacterium sp. 77mftsu3.1]SDH39822.1 LexA-binding, inner membrane-associated putative hydrolase [Microbacterium sp. 77mftsu3.1]